jgi:hypothetical protein
MSGATFARLAADGGDGKVTADNMLAGRRGGVDGGVPVVGAAAQ